MSTPAHHSSLKPADRIGVASLIVFGVTFAFGMTCLTLAERSSGVDWLSMAFLGSGLHVVGFIASMVGSVKSRGRSIPSWLGMLANGLLLPFLGPVWWLLASPVILTSF